MSGKNSRASDFEELKKAVRKPTRRIRRVPPYVPFPVDSLPSPVKEYVVAQARALGCDPVYIALPALAAVASAIGNSRAIRLKLGWKEPSILWAVIVGESGTLKSPAYDTAIVHLLHRQREMMEDYKRTMQQYQDRAKEEKEQGGGEKAEKPIVRRIVTSDITVEKLAEVLEDNPRGVLTARDELSGWFGSFTKYKGKQGGTDLPNWLEMHRAGTVIVDRKTGDRRTFFIPLAAVSVTGSIQPGTLARALTLEVLEAGLAARLLMAWPPRRPKHWTEDEVPEEIETAYTGLLDRLLSLEMEAEKRGERIVRVPYVLKLSTGGKAVWCEWYNAWAKVQAEAEGEMAAALSKLEGCAARLALLHHTVTHIGKRGADKHLVERQAVEAGVSLAKWFAYEARRIYTIISEAAEDKDIRQLVEFIESRPERRITARDLQNSNSRKYPDSEAAEAALEELVEDALGAWQDEEKPVRGGKRKRWFVLTPTSDNSDNWSDDGQDEDEAASDHRSDNCSGTPAFRGESEQLSELSDVGSNGTAPEGAKLPEDAENELSDGLDRAGNRGDAWE